MALAGKRKKKDYRVYTLLGDGEIEEGRYGRLPCSRATMNWII